MREGFAKYIKNDIFFERKFRRKIIIHKFDEGMTRCFVSGLVESP